MEKLINDLTQKDEKKALNAAKNIINNKNIGAFQLLCNKSDFLFDFVKRNIKNRIKRVVNQDNHKNLIDLFHVYHEEYADLFMEILSSFANEELSDEIYNLLENGTDAQKKYAAKYFYYIPDTIAQEKLQEYAFSNDVQLAANAAQALGAMKDEKTYQAAIEKLNDKDDFEVVKAVRFLSAYANQAAIPSILAILDKTSMAENIAAEIPYLMPILDMLETYDENCVLNCIDYILLGLGEILPLYQILDFELFETLQYLISKTQQFPQSNTARVLLRALEKFNILTSNDEYVFDESKDTKNEINEIYQLLNNQTTDFWDEQKKLLVQELFKSKQRAISALEIIKSLNISQAKESVLKFINTQTDDQVLLLAVSVAKSFNIIDQIDKQTIIQKITDATAKNIIESYFIS